MNDTTAKFIEMMLRTRGMDRMTKRIAVNKAESLEEDMAELKEEHAEEVATLKSEIDDLKRKIDDYKEVESKTLKQEVIEKSKEFNNMNIDEEAPPFVSEMIEVDSKGIPLIYKTTCECGSPAAYNASSGKVICSKCAEK